MAQAHGIEEYSIARCRPEKAGALHKLTIQFRDQLMGSRPLQNLLLNNGSPPEDKYRPESFHEIHGAVWKRDECSLHLLYLETAMEFATRPRIVGAKQGIPDLLPSFVTPEGFDFERIESLQEGWFKNLETVEKIRAFKGELEKAFDEFNLQLIVGQMRSVMSTFIYPHTCAEYKLQSRIRKAVSDSDDYELFGVLDDAYYRMAIDYYMSAGKYWSELAESEYGRNFVLNKEEVRLSAKSRAEQ